MKRASVDLAFVLAMLNLAKLVITALIQDKRDTGRCYHGTTQ